MKNKYLIAFLVVIIVTGLYFLGNYLTEPKYGNDEKNPYDLKLDSIGKIDKDKYGSYKESIIILNIENCKAIAVNNDKIIISGDNKIQIRDKKGKLLNEFNTDETATAVEINYKGLIYAGIKDHIEIFDTLGNLIEKFKSLGEKAYITSVTADDKFIYASEAESELVYVLNKRGFINNIIGDSVPANDIMRFVLPSYYFDIDIDPDGNLWIANTGKHKLISVYSNGEMRSNWGTSSSNVEDFCGCCNPTHFKITEDGSFITSEKGIIRIKKYDAAGNFVHAIAGPDHFKKGSIGLDIAVDYSGVIYVLEPIANTIHVFKEI